jgi:hypothetical protein
MKEQEANGRRPSPLPTTWEGDVTDDGRDFKPKFDRLTLLNNGNVKEAKQPFSTFELRPEQLRVQFIHG